MFATLLLMIVGIVVVMVVPTAIYFVFKTLGRIAGMEGRAASLDASAEARLARMEDAIDAMAVQIERLRTAPDRRYVSAGPDERSRDILRETPPPDDENPPA